MYAHGARDNVPQQQWDRGKRGSDVNLHGRDGPPLSQARRMSDPRDDALEHQHEESDRDRSSTLGSTEPTSHDHRFPRAEDDHSESRDDVSEHGPPYPPGSEPECDTARDERKGQSDEQP